MDVLRRHRGSWKRSLQWTVALTLCVAGSSTLAAQEIPLEAGARVRLKAPPVHPDWVNGAVTGFTDGSLTLAPEDSKIDSPLLLGRNQITELEVYRGRKSAAGRGALIGLGSGALAGLGLALIACDGWNNDCLDTDVGTIAVAIYTVAIGAAGGAAIGALIGLAVKTDDWEPVPTERIRVSIGTGTRGRLELALSVAL